MTKQVILKIKNLVTAFDTEEGRIRAVENVSFEVKKGQTLGIVGESGCGKSVTALSIMRLLPKPTGVIEGGEILFHDKDIATLPAEKMHEIRGYGISMIFQEPMTALNPVHKIGMQLGEVYQLHFPDMNAKEIWEKSIEMLQKLLPRNLSSFVKFTYSILYFDPLNFCSSLREIFSLTNSGIKGSTLIF